MPRFCPRISGNYLFQFRLNSDGFSFTGKLGHESPANTVKSLSRPAGGSTPKIQFGGNEIDQVSWSANLFGFSILNGNAESLFDRHHNLDAVHSHKYLICSPA